MGQFGQQEGEPSPNFGIDYPAEVLTPDEVAALIGRCSVRGKTGIRNRALLMLLYRSGLRVSEAVGSPARPERRVRGRDGQVKVVKAQPAVAPLRVSDIDLGTHSIRILDTKSGKAQTRGFHPSVDDSLIRWMDTRKTLGFPRAPLFCTLSGGPVHPQQVRNLVKRLAREAGIEKRVHPHGLRHTFAAELRRNGMGEMLISDLLGHSSLAVTNRYLKHLGNFEAVQALESIQLPEVKA
jgi:integrase/recombinase XerD